MIVPVDLVGIEGVKGTSANHEIIKKADVQFEHRLFCCSLKLASKHDIDRFGAFFRVSRFKSNGVSFLHVCEVTFRTVVGVKENVFPSF